MANSEENLGVKELTCIDSVYHDYIQGESLTNDSPK